MTYLAVGCTFGYTNASSVEVGAFHDSTADTDETNLEPVIIDAVTATGVNDAANLAVKIDKLLLTHGTLTSDAADVKKATATKCGKGIGPVGTENVSPHVDNRLTSHVDG